MSHSYLQLRQLKPSHLPALQAHLLRLSDGDRVQRFAQPAADEVVQAYLRSLDFERDAHYGMWDQAGLTPQLLAHTHLAIDARQLRAEIGISVDAGQRRRGIASTMLRRALLHARNLGLDEVVMYFLPYNTELIELARHLGMRLSLGQGEGMARFNPPRPNMGSLGAELMANWSEAAGSGLLSWAGQTAEASGTLCQLWRTSAAEAEQEAPRPG